MLGVTPAHCSSMPPVYAMQHGETGCFEILQQAYMEYAGALRDPCFEAGKARISTLSDQLQAKGVYGNNALQLLQKYSNQINWQGMSQDVFSSFYRFVYFICREPGKRNVQVGTAVAAWRLVLCGCFRLLDRWCSYVGSHHKASVVLEDTWRQVLDFSRTVHEDLSNYDPASAWPVLLDEFVEHIKGRRQAHGSAPLAVEPVDILSPWATRTMTAVSPRSGSKRRPPDILEVADQLQQLPLAEAAHSGAAGSGSSIPASPGSQRVLLTAKRLRLAGTQLQALTAGGSGGSIAGSMAGAGGAMIVGVLQHAAAGAWPPSVPAAGGMLPPTAVLPGGGAAGDVSNMRGGGGSNSRRTVGSVGGAMSSFGQLGPSTSQCSQQQAQQGAGLYAAGSLGPPAPRHTPPPPQQQQQQRHQQQSMLGPGAGMPPAAGLVLREAGLSSVAAVGFGPAAAQPSPQSQQQQQQQLGMGGSGGGSSSSMDIAIDSPEPLVQLQPQPQQHATGLQRQQQQQPGEPVLGAPGRHHQQAVAHLPPCPSPSHMHLQHPVHLGVRSEAEMRRANSVIAMMQVTVTEALGFN